MAADLECSVCTKLPTFPIYHCFNGHILCSICLPGPVDKLKQCHCCTRPKLTMHYCHTTTKLLSNTTIVCGNNINGCKASLSFEEYNTHLQTCPFSKYICPMCVHQEFGDLNTLKAHFEDAIIHEITTIGSDEQQTLQMRAGDSILLQEESTKDLFVLTLKMGRLSLHHMCWDNPRGYKLTVHDENKTLLILSTTSSKVTPTPSIEGMSLIIPPESVVTCNVALDLKSDVQALSGRLTSTKALVCQFCLEIATTIPIYHCLNGHLVCDKCRNGNLSCQDCKGYVKVCSLASSLVQECDFDCPNKANGCNKQLTLQDVANHLEKECLKVLFCCPKCPKECADLQQLREHLAHHPSKKLRFNKGKDLTVTHGVNLIAEKESNEYYLLISDGDELCVQHLYGSVSRKYSIFFTDGNQTWGFIAETTEMDRTPKITPGCFKLPMARPCPTYPAGVFVMISN